MPTILHVTSSTVALLLFSLMAVLSPRRDSYHVTPV